MLLIMCLVTGSESVTTLFMRRANLGAKPKQHTEKGTGPSWDPLAATPAPSLPHPHLTPLGPALPASLHQDFSTSFLLCSPGLEPGQSKLKI